MKQARPMRGEVMGKIWGRGEGWMMCREIMTRENRRTVVGSRGHFTDPRLDRFEAKIDVPLNSGTTPSDCVRSEVISSDE